MILVTQIRQMSVRRQSSLDFEAAASGCGAALLYGVLAKAATERNTLAIFRYRSGVAAVSPHPKLRDSSLTVGFTWEWKNQMLTLTPMESDAIE